MTTQDQENGDFNRPAAVTPLPAIERGSVSHQLDELRRSLLDLSRRNRLLNHRLKGSKSLAIVDEMPSEIYRLLVIKRKPLDFLAKEEASSELDWDQYEHAFDSKDVGRFTLAPLTTLAGQRHQDLYLQTALTEKSLQSRLLKLAREARSAQQEMGTNLLFLTLGVAFWQEPESQTSRSPAKISRAPILFIPVELTRKNVQSRHKLRLLDEDIILNPCLVELSQRSFQFQWPEFTDDESEEQSLSRYFSDLREAMEAGPGWRIADEIHLGLFSFQKFLMYRDLDPAHWPMGRSVAEHAVVRQLLGEAQDHQWPTLSEPELDERCPARESFQVLDADSSQRRAIWAAKQGRSFVIQGPPGTGKSQTITNIIAELMAQGKTVLFVAEKAAALEVVHRRLEAVELGDFVLELHSRKTHKRQVYQELHRCLERDPKAAPKSTSEVHELERSITHLNDLRALLHARHQPMDRSLQELLSRILGLQTAPEAPVDIAEYSTWSQQRLQQSRELCDKLARVLERVPNPSAHAWRGAGWTHLDLRTRQQLKDKLESTISATETFYKCWSEWSPWEDQAAQSVGDFWARLDGLKAFLEADLPAGFLLLDDAWSRRSAELATWLRRGQERAKLRQDWQSWVVDSAEDEDWSALIQRRKDQSGSLFRIFQPSWYRDNNSLAAIRKPDVTLDSAAELRCLKMLTKSRELKQKLESQAELGALFGALYQGVNSDFQALQKCLERHREFQTRARASGLSLEALSQACNAAGVDTLRQLLATMQAAIESFDKAFRDWIDFLECSEQEWLNEKLEDIEFTELMSRLRELVGKEDQASDWSEYQALAFAGKKLGLKDFIKWAGQPEQEPARGQLADAFERQLLRLWLDHQMKQQPQLARFRAADHKDLIERFQQLDRDWMVKTRQRLAALLDATKPHSQRVVQRDSRLGILKGEMKKKRRHMPLRLFFEKCGPVVQAMKPCFMMSPMSVAQYLSPGGLQFDAVIFDEASQVEPADALGAMARGQQTILVGDEKQLPPTRFFSKVDVDDGDAEMVAQATDLESVLALGALHFGSQWMLRWHYRSAHQSLIDFSNQHFYDQALRVFPAPTTSRQRLGLKMVHLPGAVYDRGGRRVNIEEAKVVAQAVMEHARRRPQWTLGVGAFSMAQQQAIEDEIEELRRSQEFPEFEIFDKAHEHEPFFVKNLETIQGDERDVIFLSVGYGRDSQGKLTMNFGPLNKDGGWRRLNVLVTRARRRCQLFSSLLAEDIDLSKTQAQGVWAFKQFLSFANAVGAAAQDQQQELEPSQEVVRDFVTRLERELRADGWQLHKQVGCDGFTVPLAVVDPRDSERYLLALETDGETYAKLHVARDRERIRPDVLKGLGWNVERLWTLEWSQRFERRLKALKDRLHKLRAQAPAADDWSEESVSDWLEAAKQSQQREQEDSEEDSQDDNEGHEALEDTQAALRPELEQLSKYKQFPDADLGSAEHLLATSVEDLFEIILPMLTQESPIHEKLVIKRVTSWFGTAARGQAKKAVNKALKHGLAKQRLRLVGDFYCVEGIEPQPYRWRPDDCLAREAEFIPQSEYQQALLQALRDSHGLMQDRWSQAAGHLLGFKRVGSKLEKYFSQAQDSLKSQGQVTTDEQGFVVIRESEESE